MFFLLIIFLPLLGSIFAGFFGKIIGHKGSFIISTINTFLTLFLSIKIFLDIILYETNFYLNLNDWIYVGNFYCPWGFIFDTLTAVMLIIVTSISSIVHLYSAEYMKDDPHYSRFTSFLSLFTFFMIILVTANNFIQMFVGWEGVGFCSFLLISFWFTRIQANKSALKAMIVNRIGDLMLIFSFLLIFINVKSVDYFSIFALIPDIVDKKIFFLSLKFPIIDIICILLFFGAMGKSAQIFLHVWLPDAMEGPTPVSALIHAATMVTAGIYLVARCSPIFEYSFYTLQFMTIIGALTAFFASIVAIFQNDLKKIIAYSTCSQLGYMFFACGLSNYTLSIFHLSNHAFFKALLFLTSGSVIHAMCDEQDIRKMGGLKKILPFSYLMFLIGSLALSGFPFLTGYYSKDAILEIAYVSYDTVSHFAFWLGTLAAFCSSFYSTRLIYLTFLVKINSFKKVISNSSEPSLKITFSLFFLFFGAIFIGYFSKDMFIGLGTSFWNNSIFIKSFNNKIIEAEFLKFNYKIIPTLSSFLGIFLAFCFYNYQFNFLFNLKISKIGIVVYNFFNKKYYFDKLYNEFLNQIILKYSYNITFKLIDKGFIEYFGPRGIINLFFNLSKNLISIQTGYIFNYLLLMILGLLVLIYFIFLFTFKSNFFISINILYFLILFFKPTNHEINEIFN